MEKQTGVEWLVEQLSNYDLKMVELFKNEIKQAKEMEEEQKGYSEEDLKQAFKDSRKANIFEENKPPLYKDFEEWSKQF